jgi:carboxymethylenebutenolidase
MQSEDAIGFLAAPDGGGAPGVVMIPDVWGLSDHYRDLAVRLAAEGFAVLALDPYRKTGKDAFSEPAEAMAWIDRLSDPLVLATVQEGVDHLAANEVCAGHKIGVTGFCMGGQYTLLAACTCRGLSACAPFYGMVRYAEGLDPAKKPRQPLDALSDLTCSVLGFYGEDDAIIPPADVEALRAGLASSAGGEVVLYSGAGHAFMNDTREALYRPDAAADAWPRLVAYLRDALA